MVNTLIPKYYREVFYDVKGFEELPLDSECGLACLKVIIQANNFLELCQDIGQTYRANVWYAAADQCAVIINS